jgi:hypothetical protein
MKTLCLTLATALATALAPTANAQSSGGMTMTTQPEAQQSALHDFDFLIGSWRVHHYRLKARLADNHDWVEFEGTSRLEMTMNGAGTFDDNWLDLPGGAYRAVGIRAYDPKTGLWSIWWLDGRSPQGPLDPPVRGRFENGVGTFLGDDVFNGKPIKVRYTWSRITPNSAHWEQAFSPDAGKTWETNWRMDLTRTAP